MSGNAALSGFFKKKKKKGKKKKFAFKIKSEDDSVAPIHQQVTENVVPSADGWVEKVVEAAPILEGKDVAEIKSANEKEAEDSGGHDARKRVEVHENRKEFWRMRKDIGKSADEESEKQKPPEVKKPQKYQVRRRVAAEAAKGAVPQFRSRQQFPTLGASQRSNALTAEETPPPVPAPVSNNCWSVLDNTEFAAELQEEEGPQTFIPSVKWNGPKKGYFFGMKRARRGYILDPRQDRNDESVPVDTAALESLGGTKSEDKSEGKPSDDGAIAKPNTAEEASLPQKADTSRFKKKKKKKKKKGFKKKAAAETVASKMEGDN